MAEINEALSTLGFGKNDIKVYLSLLKHEDTQIVDIAKRSGVHRVNVYDAIRNLSQKGLITHKVKGKRKLYCATDPKALLRIVNQHKQQVETILPQLEAFHEQKEQAVIMEGIEGVKHTLQDILESKEDIFAYGIPKAMPEQLKHFLVGFHRDRIASKQHIKHIYNSDAKERIKYLKDMDGSEAKALDKQFDTPATTVIYGSKTAFWIWKGAEPFCVIIDSQAMAGAYKKYFEIFWKLAE